MTKRSKSIGRSRRNEQKRRRTADAGQPRPVIAVINTSDDLVLALRNRLLDEGYEIVIGHIRDIKVGRTNFETFLRTHRPAVVIYDIAIPYEDNWTFFNTLRHLPQSLDQPFIVTTVNKRVLEQRVGKTDAIELVGGHADDFEPVVDALAAATQRVTVRAATPLSKTQAGARRARRSKRP